MIDLMNYDKRRGVGILRSKEIRIIVNAEGNINVYSRCIKDYCEHLEATINSYVEEGSAKTLMKSNLKAIKDWSKEITKEADKIEDVFV